MTTVTELAAPVLRDVHATTPIWLAVDALPGLGPDEVVREVNAEAVAVSDSGPMWTCPRCTVRVEIGCLDDT
ncbi:MAG: hypothetical protein V9G19_00715 [Tetrasphaera sp.]